MSVIIKEVTKGSPAYKKGLKAGDVLININGNEIMDVLDYRFYQNDSLILLEFVNSKGKIKQKKIKKSEEAELGLIFETYLMDKKQTCRNKCVFCFIDQLPKGLRDTLYFKDDDSRLSFLFGNYITLTNISQHEVERIIKMHISPINISVHTTNPELRVKMMNNKNAGNALEIMKQFNDAGIKLNCQLVLCPGINDSKELERSLRDLLELDMVECIAAVPVGLTRYRESLAELTPYDKQTAGQTLDIIDRFGEISLARYGERRVYGADEFYILAERELPKAEYYGEFHQLENGVGLVPLLQSEVDDAIKDCEYISAKERRISIATGEAAYPFITEMVDNIAKKWDNIKCNVYPIKNNFFGGEITVSGLVTATDIKEQLADKELGHELLIPSVMLRDGGDMFLDSITLEQLSCDLGVKITPVNNDGYEFLDKILGEE